jgi:hypothetical protein
VSDVEAWDYHGYNPFVPSLDQARFRARRFSMKHNAYMHEDATSKSLAADHEAMLQQVMDRLGKNCYVEPPIFIGYGRNISIGSDFYANFKCAKCSYLFKQRISS